LPSGPSGFFNGQLHGLILVDGGICSRFGDKIPGAVVSSDMIEPMERFCLAAVSFNAR